VISIEVMRASAIEWLRYELQCKLICLERSPFNHDPCIPDVLGVNSTRRVVEVEIKRTFGDFVSNRKKDSMFRRKFLGIAPQLFYFFVPPELVAKVLPALQEGEGLLTLNGFSKYSGLPAVEILKKATPTGAKPLKLKEIVRMVAHQTGTLTSALVKIAKAKLSEDKIDAAPMLV
jgi:hypothetical protein